MLASDWSRISAGLWLVSFMSPMLGERPLSLSFTQPPDEVLPESLEDRKRKKEIEKIIISFYSDGVWVDGPGLETLHRVSFILTTSRQTSLQLIFPYFLFSFSEKSSFNGKTSRIFRVFSSMRGGKRFTDPFIGHLWFSLKSSYWPNLGTLAPSLLVNINYLPWVILDAVSFVASSQRWPRKQYTSSAVNIFKIKTWRKKRNNNKFYFRNIIKEAARGMPATN